MVQYFSPYLSVSLEAMATAFAMPLPKVEAICVRLVMDNQLAARVDSAAKTLHVRTAHRRAESLKAVSKLGEAYVGQMRNLLLRMSCLEHDLIVKPDNGKQSSSSSSGRSMAGAFGAQVWVCWRHFLSLFFSTTPHHFLLNDYSTVRFRCSFHELAQSL